MYLEILAGHTSQKAQVCKFYESNTLDCKEAVLFFGEGIMHIFSMCFLVVVIISFCLIFGELSLFFSSYYWSR